MSEKPILFSGAMVRMILAGRKTQTRRAFSWQPDGEVCGPEMFAPTEVYGVYGLDWSLKCPYGQPGDLLWVRESFAYAPNNKFVYRADYTHAINEWSNTNVLDGATGETMPLVWRPSIHMPREASRLTLKIVKIRVERVKNITPEDAWAEGCYSDKDIEIAGEWSIVTSFRNLWDSINAKRGFGWRDNPYVWIIEFKKVTA